MEEQYAKDRDYGMKQDAELISCIAHNYGRPPLENITGDTINLS